MRYDFILYFYTPIYYDRGTRWTLYNYYYDIIILRLLCRTNVFHTNIDIVASQCTLRKLDERRNCRRSAEFVGGYTIFLRPLGILSTQIMGRFEAEDSVHKKKVFRRGRGKRYVLYHFPHIREYKSFVFSANEYHTRLDCV